MKIHPVPPRPARSFSAMGGALLVGLLAAVSSLPASAGRTPIAPSPLFIGADIPGNLMLVPSVEFPTMISVANLGDYTPATIYVGYFDSHKCYKYSYGGPGVPAQANSHFFPVSVTSTRLCGGAMPEEWSGNYLNWVGTQTIDPFRFALTGGNRVRDTSGLGGETWLEKARADRDVGGGPATIFPRRRTPVAGDNLALVAGATPSSWGNIKTRVDGLGSRIWITSTGNLGAGSATVYNPDAPQNHALNAASAAVVYELHVRVKVCDKDFAGVAGLEDNCVQYPTGQYKPEGLIQEYSKRLRYSVISYLNPDEPAIYQSGAPTAPRDGAVLRAKSKFVGPDTYEPLELPMFNAAREWNASTGVLFSNPDEVDADATNSTLVLSGANEIQNSGVINYINRFGQVAVNRQLKNWDPASELYYTALRYLKKQGNVPAYSNITDGTPQGKYDTADGFPVITDWDDPIKFHCQTNVLLGIGDVNTWRDKNLPSASATTSGLNEPAKPALVAGDTTVDVIADLKRIKALELAEGINMPQAADASNFSERICTYTPGCDGSQQNSAYIAALAYGAHTRDLRPPGPEALPGKQTASTFWVDILEYQKVAYRTHNQYWLAAKYGGFDVPTGFDPDFDPEEVPDPLDLEAWHTNGETLTSGDDWPNAGLPFPRADNYFGAANAANTVTGLRNAFDSIVAEVVGSSSSFAANSIRLDAGTLAFQARFTSGSWHGDVVAYSLDPDTGALSALPVWSASNELPVWDSDSGDIDRNIWVNSGGFQRFDRDVLTALAPADQAALGNSQGVVNYLRGDRSNEVANGGTLRNREGIIGDIINSQPVYVGAPNSRLFSGATFDGADSYPAFVLAQADRMPVVYVGANDGMLHAFRADEGVASGPGVRGSGEEVFAFVPRTAIPDLHGPIPAPNKYTHKNYQHRYYVDGEVTVADVYDTNAAPARWKTILVGLMGRSIRGAYALDVTDPDDVKFLWELDEDDEPALGNTISKPVIAQVDDGDWQVIFGNGINGEGFTSQLIMVGVAGDEFGVVTSIDTETGFSADNGMSGAFAWDADADWLTETVYSGDLDGLLWKFEELLSGTKPLNPLFSTPGAYDPTVRQQPISATPWVAVNPADGKTWAFVGTGRYLTLSDLDDDDVQSWYGVIDPDVFPIPGAITPTSLLPVAIEAEGVVDHVDPAEEDFAARVIEDIDPDAITEGGYKGWFIDLVSPENGIEGERMVLSNFFQGNALIGTTRIPDASDPCNLGGKGFIMAIDPFMGGRLSGGFFDLNGDGIIDGGDYLDGKPVSGIGFSVAPNNPIFIGPIMLVTFDDATNKAVLTGSAGLTPARVSWRELVSGR